ncbi:stress-activated map kinase interacting protein 1-domain-containing protein [Gautieria morchelliformis]|nr:stress-activated map kinase interacting protein 1-domain-containing protein [Gautieria morchelliformis]
MSLVSDPDYLIHSIRLAYLRHVDDPYGPRVLALNPAYTSNPHIIASGLADHDLWPEIVMPATPTRAPDDLDAAKGTQKDAKRNSGFPGAALKYSQTIVGHNRTGAMGMRVNGKRGSLIREPVAQAGDGDTAEGTGKRHRSDSEPTPAPPSPGAVDVDHTQAPQKPLVSTLLRRRSADASELEAAPTSASYTPFATTPIAVAAPTPTIEPFKPPFARAAEMEERRRIRMRSRFASAGNQPRPKAVMDPMLGREQQDVESARGPDEEGEEDMESESGSDEDSDLMGGDGDTPLGEDAVEDDFFDPEGEGEFGPRIVLASSTSDGMLSTSNSALSTSHSSGVGAGPYGVSSHLKVAPVSRARLSPVDELHPGQHQQHSPNTTVAGATPPAMRGENLEADVTPQRTYKSDGSYFELVVPPTPGRTPQADGDGAPKPAASDVWVRDPAGGRQVDLPPSGNSSAPFGSIGAAGMQHSSPLNFTRIPVPPRSPPVPSLLSIILASSASSIENPFSELYSLISARSGALALQITYPFSEEPQKAWTLKVRADATVEEVVGFALWTYWEEGVMPKLDEVGAAAADEKRKKDMLSACGWSLRITEDGEVDDDFPAMERMAKMSKFNFEGYAILPEAPAQIEQNRAAEAKIIRRPSRVMIAKKKVDSTPSLAPPASTAGGAGGSLVSSAPLSSSVGGVSTISQGPQQFLRVKVAEKDNAHFSTTIPVKESMYMEEVLENVCRRRKIDDPKQWCLVYNMEILVPLDRTVRSLQGKTELFLVKQEDLAQYEIRRQQTRSTNPNASIFSRMSEVPEQQYSAALDFTSAYKKYTVYRKMPMLVVRHERTLAMDGDYLHIMPSSTRGFLDSMKTSSYHIKTVVACVQSAKSSSNFKLVVKRDGGNKRYDFEAESPKVATEIVRNIKDLKAKRLERSGTMSRSRTGRSRHAG